MVVHFVIQLSQLHGSISEIALDIFLVLNNIQEKDIVFVDNTMVFEQFFKSCFGFVELIHHSFLLVGEISALLRVIHIHLLKLRLLYVEALQLFAVVFQVLNDFIKVRHLQEILTQLVAEEPTEGNEG